MSQPRRPLLTLAILAALGGGQAFPEIAGADNTVPGTLTTDDLQVLGSAAVGAGLDVKGSSSTAGLDNLGQLRSSGDTLLGTLNGSAIVTIQDDLVSAVVLNQSYENGLVVQLAQTSLSGGDDTGTTTATASLQGIAIAGRGAAAGNLSVDGQTATSGLANTGMLANTGSLTSSGDARLTSLDGSANVAVTDGDAAISVQNAVGGANGVVANARDTTLSGGDDAGNTLLQATQDGIAITGNGSATGNLNVAGHTVTNGLDNSGDARLTSLDGSANVAVTDGDAAISVQNAVGGANGVVANARDTTLSGGDDAGNTLLQATQDGIAITGNGSATGNLNVAGHTVTNGLDNSGDASLASTDGTAVVSIANGTANILVNNGIGGQNGVSVTAQGTTITGVGPTAIGSADGTSGVIVDDGAASLGVENASGGTNGIAATATSTVISGGTGTTHVTVDDSGVTISGTGPSKGNLTVQGTTTLQGGLNLNGGMQVAPNRTVDFGGNRLQGVGEGVAPTDAVNLGQLDDVQQEARRGVAIAAALDTSLPDSDKRFRVNLGGGYYNGESAVALTGAGRVNRDIAVYFGIGSDTDFKETAGKIGVSYQW